MTRRRALLLAMMIAPCVQAAAAPATAGSCTSLTALTIPSVQILKASEIAAGPFTLPSGPASAQPIVLPAFCRIVALATPTSDSSIDFEVWIPPAAAWNGKLQGVGNGGYSGAISYGALAAALRRGYAAVSTDTGHSGDDMRFGQGHPEKIVDWAYRSIHVMTEAAKVIVRDADGRLPERAYFNGCSTGGHQALSEAQKYPGDYDGIVAGDPASNRIHQTAAFLWSWQATHDAGGAPILPAAKLAMITKAAVEACDAIDGIKDGVIDDPRQCHFDPAVLACKGADGPTCLTASQIEAVHKVYEGLKSPRTGEQIFTGWPKGSEGFGAPAIQGWRQYLLDPPEPMRIGFFRYFLYHDPNWDPRTIDYDRDVAYADRQMPWMSAVDRDMTAFKAHGGKLVMYTGWADPVVPPMDTVNYYEAVMKTMGAEKTKNFFRLFMAPGMGHCGGGPGPNTFDALGALEQWVENGKAPDTLIASHSTAGRVDRTRPLCVYPKIAKWKGAGSSDEADNFVCVPPAPRPRS